jgi:hypothetical protein
MKRLVFLMMFTGLLMFQSASFAQDVGRILRKTVIQPARKANDVAEDKAEEEAEKQATKAIMEGFGLSEDVEFEPEYRFDAWFRMQITEYDKKGKEDEQTVYDNYIKKGKPDYGMEFNEDDVRSIILYDSERLAMIMLTDDDGEKTGFAMRIDPENVEEDEGEEADYSSLEPYKTGNTKKILGYTCDEYLVEDEETEVHMWMSEKLGKEVSKEMLNNPNAFGAAFYYSRAVNGMILEYDVIQKDNGEKTELLVTELDLNRNHSISTKGYSIISMGLQEE